MSRPASPFIRWFGDDPPRVASPADVERIERVAVERRFPCRSTLEALQTTESYRPQSIALVDLGPPSLNQAPRQWTYREYLEEVRAAANLFAACGLQPHESVALMLPNVPEFLFALWGAQAVGIVAPINPFLAPEQIAAILREADARLLVTLGPALAPELWDKACAVARAVPELRQLIAVGGGAAVRGEGLDWEASVAAQRRDGWDLSRPLTGRETAAYFHTGGTTGVPKLARRVHVAEVTNVCQMLVTGVQPEDLEGAQAVILCGLPLFHASAYIAGALSAIMQGGKLLLAGPQGFRDRTLIQRFWRIVAEHRVTFFAVVPTVYSALLAEPVEPIDCSSLKLAGSGGAPLSVTLLESFRRRTGAGITEGYGMTECTACATAHTFKGPSKPGSVGIRLPYQRIRIVRLTDDGSIERDCRVDEVGVILLSGPNVIPEYKQSAANRAAWPAPGWLNTGDLGRCDSDGYYWITGRSKDLIIRGGHNLDPAVAEEALRQHSAVIEVAVVGMPDAYAGELPIAYVQLRDDVIVRPEDLVAFAREHVAERAVAPVEVHLLPGLPKTAVGKVYKPDLRRSAMARGFVRTIEAVCPELRCQATVIDDERGGYRVVVLAFVADAAIERLREQLAPHLDLLVHRWELGVARD